MGIEFLGNLAALVGLGFRLWVVVGLGCLGVRVCGGAYCGVGFGIEVLTLFGLILRTPELSPVVVNFVNYCIWETDC